MVTGFWRKGSSAESAATALLRLGIGALKDVASRCWASRAERRELEALLGADERFLRDVGLTRSDVVAAIDRLHAAPPRGTGAARPERGAATTDRRPTAASALRARRREG